MPCEQAQDGQSLARGWGIGHLPSISGDCLRHETSMAAKVTIDSAGMLGAQQPTGLAEPLHTV
jgi:hypothetical protein